MGVMTDGTCGECVAYNSIMCDGVPVGHGVCMVDGECVNAESPQCSNAPASHAQAISDDIGGTNGQESYNQPAKA